MTDLSTLSDSDLMAELAKRRPSVEKADSDLLAVVRGFEFQELGTAREGEAEIDRAEAYAAAVELARRHPDWEGADKYNKAKKAG